MPARLLTVVPVAGLSCGGVAMNVYAFEPRNNADLMVAAQRLGYIGDADRVLDPTFGLGRFWTRVVPASLTATDLDLERSPFGEAIDFTAMPWAARSFDVVVFDPPYKLNGTSGRGGPATSDVDYGVAGPRRSWRQRHELIRAGIVECARVCRRTLMIKCQDQVCGGKVRWQTIEFAALAASLGFELVDQLHVPGHRPQPSGRRQVHASRNYSTLLVTRRGGAR